MKLELYLLFVWVRNLVTHYKGKKHKLCVFRLLEKRVLWRIFKFGRE